MTLPLVRSSMLFGFDHTTPSYRMSSFMLPIYINIVVFHVHFSVLTSRCHQRLVHPSGSPLRPPHSERTVIPMTTIQAIQLFVVVGFLLVSSQFVKRVQIKVFYSFKHIFQLNSFKQTSILWLISSSVGKQFYKCGEASDVCNFFLWQDSSSGG